MSDSLDRVFGFPQFVRFSWSTADKIIQKNGVTFKWYPIFCSFGCIVKYTYLLRVKCCRLELCLNSHIYQYERRLNQETEGLINSFQKNLQFYMIVYSNLHDIVFAILHDVVSSNLHDIVFSILHDFILNFT